jgi:hypothetical protein
MKAQEARAIADKTNKDLIDSQYKDAKRSISLASSRGEYNTYVEIPLRVEVKKLLTDEGFTIGNTEYHRNESHTKISW